MPMDNEIKEKIKADVDAVFGRVKVRAYWSDDTVTEKTVSGIEGIADEITSIEAKAVLNVKLLNMMGANHEILPALVKFEVVL